MTLPVPAGLAPADADAALEAVRRLPARVERALAGGVDAVQLRGKSIPGALLFGLARELRAITAHAGVPFLVNDRVDVALAVRAHGVQLGAGSLSIGEARRLLPPGSLIGYSAHSEAEAAGAALAGADFVLAAPVFAPGTPKAAGAGAGGRPHDAPPFGPARLRRLAAALPIAVYGLGGIDAGRVAQVMTPRAGDEAPPAGVAVISAILGSAAAPVADPAAAARSLRDALTALAPAGAPR